MKKNIFYFFIILAFSSLCALSCSNSSDSSTNGNDDKTSEFGTKYSFYLNNTTDLPWAVIRGEKGSVLPSVTKPEKKGYRFTVWKTKNGDELPAVFGDEKLDFYANWVDSNATKQIGSKETPDAVGDIIFTDGSASPYPENLDDLTESQWKAAVAMLFTTTYNPTNGQNSSGGQYQYKLAAGLVVAKEEKWCEKYMYSLNNIYTWDERTNYDDWWESINWEQFISLYVGYLWDNNAFITEKALSPFSLSPYFGKQNLVDSKKFKTYASKYTAPAFEYVINYGEKQKIDSDFKNDWYMPSTGELKILLQDEEIRNKFNRLLQKKYLTLSNSTGILSNINGDSYFWASTTDPQSQEKTTTWISRDKRYQDGADHFFYYGISSKYLDDNLDEYNSFDTKTKIWMFDPYSGIAERPYVPISYHYDPHPNQYFIEGPYRDFCAYADYDENCPGYIYDFVFYTKSYKMNYKGIQTFDEKLKKNAVIAVRVF